MSVGQTARRLPLLFLLTAMAMPVLAADDDALRLADEAQIVTAQADDWHVFTEAALGSSAQRFGLPDLHTQRWSLDLRFDKALRPGLRVMLADRYDLRSQDRLRHRAGVNTLKEAYVSWQAADNQLVDAGWVNLHNGVAAGYNPTDYFRAGAVRSVSSVDLASLRENRLGNAMLRGQQLWDGGSLSALFSPRLTGQASASSLATRPGTANQENRWLVALSQKVSDRVDPQWLIYGQEHQPAQLGLNLTSVINDATVLYAEWSGGRGRSLLATLPGSASDRAFRSRLASGFSYTTSNRMSLALEYDYNGAGLEPSGWNTLRSGASYVQYRSLAQDLQEPVTKQSVFFYGKWQDAMLNHLDLTSTVRWNQADHSRMSWLEARYRRDHLDLVLQWQLNSGRAGSEFGALPQWRTVQAMAVYYF